ncbi:hypothetical protein [Taibaiella koreensis]|uniref:hypothetical protein n=1 Tax=Taibaiella koreensis TaxID=1268548 RepID=UPI000E599195|nr:hypothetical protein [Taibaiella koreensis]
MESFERAIAFIRSIGIPVDFCTLSGDTFLPGLQIEHGHIRVDRDRLRHPGDILHEAGHIAVVPPEERQQLCGDTIAQRDNRAAEEMMAIAWSFAACKHLSLDPGFVLHDEGYQGGGSTIVAEFESGHTFGVPMLQWAGMTAEPRQAEALGRAPYPLMTCWLRP